MAVFQLIMRTNHNSSTRIEPKIWGKPSGPMQADLLGVSGKNMRKSHFSLPHSSPMTQTSQPSCRIQMPVPPFPLLLSLPLSLCLSIITTFSSGRYLELLFSLKEHRCHYGLFALSFLSVCFLICFQSKYFDL